MPWWLWALIVVAVLLVLVVWVSYRATKNPAGYMSRSQSRLSIAERMLDEISQKVRSDGTVPKNIMRTETKLYSLMEAQKKERIPDPVLEEHREAYTQLLRFQWLKMQDLRTTGGQNLDDIVAAEEAFGEEAEEAARERFDHTEQLRRDLGIAPRDWN